VSVDKMQMGSGNPGYGVDVFAGSSASTSLFTSLIVLNLNYGEFELTRKTK
jgi:hypothetical protein